MKNILKVLPILLSVMLLTSCLKAGLDDLPAFDDNEISNLSFEYRWIEDVGGNDQLQVVQMDVKNTIDKMDSKVNTTITVPSTSKDLPGDVRRKISLKGLVAYVDISTAALISPIEGSPILGVPADWSAKEFKYKVVAANGDEKIWTIIIDEFINE